MSGFIEQFDFVVNSLKMNLPFILLLILTVYGIHVVNWLVGFRLNVLGIYPRKLFGLIGIIFSPFLHGNFNHLFFNSIPFFILASFILISGMKIFIYVSAVVMLISGLGTWVFGRKGFHVGASGVIMGYWGFLLLNAYENRTPLALGLAVVVLYYFAGMIFNVFPTSMKSSWEAHVFGLIGGLVAAYFLMYI
jgi:membrane associated rhomboid family serine protease